MAHTKTDRNTSGGPREFSTGGPMVNGPLWCSLMSVSLFFRLMMGVEDVGGKWIEYASRRNAIWDT